MSEIKRSLAKSYDEDALRRSQSAPSEWKVREREKFMDRLRGENRRSILEIGAGTGIDSLFFRDNGLDVTCIDLSEGMIRFCMEKGLRAKVMDFYELDFPDGSFDAVYALNCLLHVPGHDIDRVLEGIRRVLKPGGLFFMGVYGGHDSEGIWAEDWCEPKRLFVFRSDEAVQSLTKRHFALEYFQPVPLEPGNRFRRRPFQHFQSLVLRKTVETGSR